jgi:hypothetical protein
MSVPSSSFEESVKEHLRAGGDVSTVAPAKDKSKDFAYIPVRDRAALTGGEQG